MSHNLGDESENNDNTPTALDRALSFADTSPRERERRSSRLQYSEGGTQAQLTELEDNSGKVNRSRAPSQAHIQFLKQREEWKKTKSSAKRRTVSVDLGLMSVDQIAAEGREGVKPKTNLELVLAEYHQNHPYKLCPTVDEAKEQTRWFLDHATIKISVSRTMKYRQLRLLHTPLAGFQGFERS